MCPLSPYDYSNDLTHWIGFCFVSVVFSPVYTHTHTHKVILFDLMILNGNLWSLVFPALLV